MAEYIFRQTVGSEESHDDLLMSNVAIVKGQVLYRASGYVTNASAAAITCQTVVGVAAETVDNSGGAAGDKKVNTILNYDALYEAPSSGTLSQAQVGTNVTMDAVTNFDEDDPVNDYTGVIHIFKRLSASKGLVRLNFFSPRA